MALGKKLILPIVLIGGCLVVFGVWRLGQSTPGDSNGRSEGVPTSQAIFSGDVQAPIAIQPETRVVTLGVGASSADKLPPSAASTIRNDASGTLNDQVERALSIKDGPTAANLATKLKECEINLKIMAVESTQGAQPSSDPAVQLLRSERLQEYQRTNSACQTISGDRNQLRLRLLDIAVQQGVMGAAVESFEAGSLEPAILARVVSDANLGDVKALATVAMYDAKVFGVTRDAQDAARYALKLASVDPVIGKRVINYLKIAESYAVPNSSFDFSKISSAARTQGLETAGRLKEKLGRQTP